MTTDTYTRAWQCWHCQAVLLTRPMGCCPACERDEQPLACEFVLDKLGTLELSIAELLDRGPRVVEDLPKLTGHPRSYVLRAVARLLAAGWVVTDDGATIEGHDWAERSRRQNLEREAHGVAEEGCANG